MVVDGEAVVDTKAVRSTGLGGAGEIGKRLALSSKSSYNRLMIKNNLKGHLILSVISVANASVWYFFFQQINTYINH
jgi:hypothetical protein